MLLLYIFPTSSSACISTLCRLYPRLKEPWWEVFVKEASIATWVLFNWRWGIYRKLSATNICGQKWKQFAKKVREQFIFQKHHQLPARKYEGLIRYGDNWVSHLDDSGTMIQVQLLSQPLTSCWFSFCGWWQLLYRFIDHDRPHIVKVLHRH